MLESCKLKLPKRKKKEEKQSLQLVAKIVPLVLHRDCMYSRQYIVVVCI